MVAPSALPSVRPKQKAERQHFPCSLPKADTSKSWDHGLCVLSCVDVECAAREERAGRRTSSLPPALLSASQPRKQRVAFSLCAGTNRRAESRRLVVLPCSVASSRSCGLLSFPSCSTFNSFSFDRILFRSPRKLPRKSASRSFSRPGFALPSSPALFVSYFSGFRVLLVASCPPKKRERKEKESQLALPSSPPPSARLGLLNPRCPYFLVFLLLLYGLSRPCPPFLPCQKKRCAVGSKPKAAELRTQVLAPFPLHQTTSLSYSVAF